MNTLRLNITISSLSILTPVGTDQYLVYITALNASGLPLNNPYIPNTHLATITTTSTTFNVDVPIIDGTYTITGVTFKAYANSSTNCCFATALNQTVTNTTSGSTPAITLLGTYEQTVAGRHYTYQKSEFMEIQINGDGSISDITPGNIDGSLNVPTVNNGKMVYYMMGYGWFCQDGDGVNKYIPFKNVQLADGFHTIRRFDTNPDICPTLSAFQAGSTGYGPNAVTLYTATLSEIQITIRTLASPKIPEWLVVTRKIQMPPFAPNRAIGRKKLLALQPINTVDTPVNYHAKGIHTGLKFGGESNQPNTFYTFESGWLGLPLLTNDYLYNLLRGYAAQYGLTPDSVITDQVPERTQGTDSTIYDRMYYAYRGLMDLFRETAPTLNKRNTNLYGPYGQDDFTGLVNYTMLYRPESAVKSFLDERIFDEWDPTNLTWRNTTNSYYASNQIDVRNVNVGYYMYNTGQRMIPYELLMTNERIKIGTKTYGGQDRESNWAVFTWPHTQTLVRDAFGNQIGVEDSRRGEIIQYPAGIMKTRYYPPAVASEHYHLGFWSTLIGNGIIYWSPDKIGTDPTKIDFYKQWPEWEITWRPTGGSDETYVPGLHGAPQNEYNVGLKVSMTMSAMDNGGFGWLDARAMEGYADVLYAASYTSSRKVFTVVPGQNGQHLNGYGVLNKGMLWFKHAYDQKAGVAVIGTGPSGYMGAYYNGFLSEHEYEDSVILTYGSISVNLGRVYGRQTRWFKGS